MAVPILEQGSVLIASLPADQDDAALRAVQESLLERVARDRARGVVLDVSAVEVLDSYAVRTLRTIAYSARLCGATTCVAGIRPAVAFAMTQLGIDLQGIATALDLDDALVVLRRPAAAAELPGGGRGDPADGR
jgi:rsbT antagonist protein RsbS